jgi:hypothetical protein
MRGRERVYILLGAHAAARGASGYKGRQWEMTAGAHWSLARSAACAHW